jgi:xanthine dehydrogenase accessory factor
VTENVAPGAGDADPVTGDGSSVAADGGSGGGVAARVADLEQRLAADRVPFVHATVVRAEAPTSARPGDVALVRGDGSVEGFVGGHCARGNVQAAALDTLASGESLLLRIVPDDATGFPEVPGARVTVNPCLSGGAIEVFLRPHLPPPLVAVVGDSPIADALVAVARTAGYAVARRASGPPADAVVLAGHTGDEGPAVVRALASGAGYVGLVASPRRAAAVLDSLGLAEDERKRVHSPAGLWLGGRTPGEIAVSILAEIVREVGGRNRSVRTDRPAAGPESSIPGAGTPRQVLDPVCGMTVVVGPDTPHAVVDGADVWFCGPGCRDHHVATVAIDSSRGTGDDSPPLAEGTA